MSSSDLKVVGRAARGGLLCALLLAFSFAVRAQQKAEDRRPPKTGAAAPATTPPATGVGEQVKPADRDALAKEATRKRVELSESETLLLAPAPEDVEAFADFLKQRSTGLVRLLPRETFGGKLAIRGDGAYYSFVRLTHEQGYGSDIYLERDHFSTGLAGADIGFLVDLGDAPLEGVARDTYGVRHLAEYKPPTTEAKAREEQRRSSEGFEVEGFTHKSRLPVRLDNTYALRSIDYGDSDVLVAFRVVRKDSDGSAVLLWKLLKKYSKPQLERSAATQ